MGIKMLRPLVLALFTASIAVVSTSPACRCLFGEPCWPTERDFSLLASRVSQPLLHPTPVASVCYPQTSSSAQCEEIKAQFSNPTWRADQASALMNANFETYVHENGTIDACYPDATLGYPCAQGSIPPVGIDARNAQDIQEAVNFARQHNLRLVIKNTGHDLLGRSAGRGGFLLWTHNVKGLTYNENFVPDDASSGTQSYQAITLGAGVLWGEAYEFADLHGRLLVGGVAVGGSVGAAGGWIMGTGHSPLSPKYGLGADNALQFTAVLADGTHVVANAFTNSDLFWALRGGGAGTYAVVTSVIYRSYPSVPLTSIKFSTLFPSDSPSVAKSVLANFIKSTHELGHAGWGGVSTFMGTYFDNEWVAPEVSLEDAKKSFKPYDDFMQEATGGNIKIEYKPFKSYYEWFYKTYVASGVPFVGKHMQVASRFVSQTTIETSPEKVAEVMLSVQGFIATLPVAGGAVSRGDPESVAANPLWRQAALLLEVVDLGQEGSTIETLNQSKERIEKNVEILDSLDQESGTYSNEASLHDKDWKNVFFGPHYSKLESIRTKYDPESLFIVPRGVGSDEWDDELRCRIHGVERDRSEL